MRDFHYHIANLLLTLFDIVVIPALAVKKENRNICRAAVRIMLAWSHYAFRQRVKQASFWNPGKYVLCPGEGCDEVAEPRTCGACGRWNKDHHLGCKEFVCPFCGARFERQAMAARNNAICLGSRAEKRANSKPP